MRNVFIPILLLVVISMPAAETAPSSTMIFEKRETPSNVVAVVTVTNVTKSKISLAYSNDDVGLFRDFQVKVVDASGKQTPFTPEGKKLFDYDEDHPVTFSDSSIIVPIAPGEKKVLEIPIGKWIELSSGSYTVHIHNDYLIGVPNSKNIPLDLKAELKIGGLEGQKDSPKNPPATSKQELAAPKK